MNIRSLFLKIFLWFWATMIGTAVVLALSFRLGPHAPPERWRIAWIFALPISGAICYALTRYLTRPVLRLSAAARRLASGELAARALDPKRRDEIGALVRDFNVMAERIEELITSQRQLIADISHELRSPLARINATLGVARQRLGQSELFDRVERDTGRLDEMIGRLLLLARLDAVGAAPDMRTIDLAALLADVVADARWEAGERGCRVESTADPCADIAANPDLLRSAVENVIRNAIRYTAPGSAVDVQLARHPDGAVIRVADRGPGVAPQELDNIFRPFYRLAEARDRQSGGAGLGLAIAARVARVHGGIIRAENRPGGGLEVTLMLVSGAARA